MSFYIALFFFFFCLTLIDIIDLGNEFRSLSVLFGGGIVFFLLWILTSIRWEVGTDWISYHDTFTLFTEGHKIAFEPGFIFLISLIKEITNSYTVYLAIFGILVLFPKFYFTYKHFSRIFFLTAFFYFCYYFGDIFSVRQSFAISITVFSTFYIIEKKPFKFIFLILIATTIHYTSIFFLAAYLVYWRKISYFNWYILLSISFILGLTGFGSLILDKALNVVGLSSVAGEKINAYLNSEDSLGTQNDPILIYTLGVLKRVILIPLFIYTVKHNHYKTQEMKGFLNLVIFGNILYFLFAKDLQVFTRAAVPFLFFEIFLLALVVKNFTIKRRIALGSFVIVFCFFLSASRFYALVNSYYDLYVPYTTIFNKRIDRVLE